MVIPPLRGDLKFSPGPFLKDGSPTLTLYDPVQNRFYRMGWPASELLARWSLADMDKIIACVNRETTLRVTSEDIQTLKQFLLMNCLFEPLGPDVLNHLKSNVIRRKESFLKWLLLNYLFIRIPLSHPDRFLDATLPAVRMLVSRPFLCLLGLAACLTLFLIMPRWEAFTHTFLYFFSLEGVVLYALAIFFVKIIHELGHAYTAKHYGVNVPTMGIAFLIFWPVLYTDNSDAWRLNDRAARMAIVGAGTLAELGLAVLATLTWCFLSDGPIRSACFVVATVTWISSLLINFNPFLRFDGYYLLSDFLDVPNLQARAFALGKQFLRKIVLGLESPCPEPFSSGKKTLLISYAYSTWLYRLALFTAIALMVYHLFFKALGIFLFVTEMIWFVVRPVYRELHIWWRIFKSQDSGRSGFGNLRVLCLLLLLICFLILLIIPWNSYIHAPALLRSGPSIRIYPPFSAQIKTVQMKNGQKVRAGDTLFVLNSPQLAFRERQAETQVRMLEELLRRQFTHTDLLEQSQIIQRQLAEASAELQGCRIQKKQLRVAAPMDGRITDMAEGLRPGIWVSKRQFVAVLVNRDEAIVEGYLTEASLESVKPGDSARFYMENRDAPAIGCTVHEIAPTSSRTLNALYLASVYGGDIPVSLEKEDMLIPYESFYRIILTPVIPDGKHPHQVVRGSVLVRGKPQSLIHRAWVRVIAVLIRESGF